MDMNAVGLNATNASLPTSGGNDVEAQISALRQKLQYLTSQKQKAKQAHNSEKAKKLERQIQQIRKRIQQLERRRSSDVNRTSNSKNGLNSGLAALEHGEKNNEPGLGRFVDTRV